MDFSNCPVTLILIAANAIFSFIGFSNEKVMDKAIGWPYYEKRNNQYYRWISSGFLHADTTHLFFNMITLLSFGNAVEYYFSGYGLGGNIAYLALYFAALIIADIPSYLKYKDNYNYRSLGASGAVCAVVFAAIVFNPWGILKLLGIVPVPAVLYAILFVVYCVYMGKKRSDNVNHDAHLWGAVFGLAFTLILINIMQPQLLKTVIDKFTHPALFGR